MTDFKAGDRVRVTFEAVVESDSAPAGACLCSFRSNGGRIRKQYLDNEDFVIEKIEPPVQVFKPGDVVIRKSDGAPILLADQGYVYLREGGRYYPYGTVGRTPEHFNSELYERGRELA